jgi:hypothetical protein
MADLCDLNDDDGLARYYASSWLETCYTILDMLGEMLNLDNIVLENEIIQIGGGCATDEADLSGLSSQKT